MRKLTPQEFLDRANEVHDNRYEYPFIDSEYINTDSTITIKCREHGLFYKTARSHLQGVGCPKCRGGSPKRLSLEEVLVRLNDLFKGNGYKYPYIEKEYYSRTGSEITVVCPIHGEFKKKLNLLLMGYGCSTCLNKFSKYNKDSFINEINDMYGNNKFLFPYIDTEFELSFTKNNLTVICPVHGKFISSKEKLLKGDGCPLCKKESLERDKINRFLSKVNLMYNGFGYEYPKLKDEYKTYNSKITLKCPIHGEVILNANEILKGHGCPYCSGRKFSLDDFLFKAYEMFFDKYDYPYIESEFKNGISSKITVRCPIHGDFKVVASDHIRKGSSGCKKCGIDKRKTTKLEFLKRSFELYGNLYYYPLLNEEFTDGGKSILTIYCRKHNEYFRRSAESHLRGKKGCPKCKTENFSNGEKSLLKYIDDTYHLYYFENYKGLFPKKNREVDMYFPEIGLCVEYNGVRWHSLMFNKKSHIYKNLHINNKIKIINIYENEWLHNKKAVENTLQRVIDYKKNVYVECNGLFMRLFKHNDELTKFIEDYSLEGINYCNYNSYIKNNSTIVAAFELKIDDNCIYINNLLFSRYNKDIIDFLYKEVCNINTDNKEIFIKINNRYSIMKDFLLDSGFEIIDNIDSENVFYSYNEKYPSKFPLKDFYEHLGYGYSILTKDLKNAKM